MCVCALLCFGLLEVGGPGCGRETRRSMNNARVLVAKDGLLNSLFVFNCAMRVDLLMGCFGRGKKNFYRTNFYLCVMREQNLHEMKEMRKISMIRVCYLKSATRPCGFHYKADHLMFVDIKKKKKKKRSQLF